MTRVRTVDVRAALAADALASALDPVVDHLRGDGLLAYPTETVYGFGGRASPDAVRALAALKGREEHKPFLVLVSHRSSVEGLRWTDAATELAEIFWPGALTLVLADPRGIFPRGVRSASGGVAVRMSPHPVVRHLVEALGEPLTSTSANLPGEPPAASGAAAAEVAGRLVGGSAVVVVDGGRLPPSPPSTVVDCTGLEPVVVREGSVPVARLRCAIPEIHGSHEP